MEGFLVIILNFKYVSDLIHFYDKLKLCAISQLNCFDHLNFTELAKN